MIHLNLSPPVGIRPPSRKFVATPLVTTKGSSSFAQVTAAPTSHTLQERQPLAPSAEGFPVLAPPTAGGARVSADMSYRNAIREEVLEVREKEKGVFR